MSMIKTVTAGFSKMLATKKHGATKKQKMTISMTNQCLF